MSDLINDEEWKLASVALETRWIRVGLLVLKAKYGRLLKFNMTMLSLISRLTLRVTKEAEGVSPIMDCRRRML